MKADINARIRIEELEAEVKRLEEIIRKLLQENKVANAACGMHREWINE